MKQFGAAGALLYLKVATLKGWWRARLDRLKQPKYLVGAVLGVAYLYTIFLRPRATGPRSPAPQATADALAIAPDFAAAVLLLVLAIGWIVPRGRAGLAFTEAEIAFLFPGPISRRALIHYRLIGSLAGLALSALIMTLVSSRWGFLGVGGWGRGLGWWVVLATVSLHFTATSFAVTRLLERGVGSPARSVAVLGALGLAIGACFTWTAATLPRPTQADLANAGAVLRYAGAALQDGPASWLLAAPRLVVTPLFAADTSAFLPALGAALLLLAAHYAWVLYSAVSFEEESLARAEKRAVRLAALKSGRLRSAPGLAKKRPDPFVLREAGAPEVAFLWKNLVAMGRLFTLRMGLVAAAIVAAGCLWLSATPELRAAQGLVGTVATFGLAMVLLFGPRLARQDLRADLRNSDILKTYPLPGWRIVLGEMLAPLAALSAFAWLALLAIALVFPPLAQIEVPLLAKLAGFLGIALFTPFFCALQLVIQNAISLLFPAWVETVSNPGEHGLDVLGQRLIFLAGQLLLLALGMLPPVLIALVTLLVARSAAGTIAAAVLAWGVLLAVLGVEVWLGVRWLGARFERFDLSAELRP